MAKSARSARKTSSTATPLRSLSLSKRERASDMTESLILRLESIVEPLNFARIFPIAHPLEIELGAGDGSFLIAYARQHPERNFMGVERLLGRLRKID